MSGVDGLKGLLQKAQTSLQIAVCLSVPEQKLLPVTEKWVKYRDVESFFKDKVVVPKAMYDGQVHVDRKQLSEDWPVFPPFASLPDDIPESVLTYCLKTLQIKKKLLEKGGVEAQK